MCVDPHQNPRMRLVPLNMFKSYSECLFLFLFLVYLCYAVLSVPCSLVITCWERADLALGSFVCCVFLCFCHFPIWCSVLLGLVLNP